MTTEVAPPSSYAIKPIGGILDAEVSPDKFIGAWGISYDTNGRYRRWVRGKFVFTVRNAMVPIVNPEVWVSLSIGPYSLLQSTQSYMVLLGPLAKKQEEEYAREEWAGGGQAELLIGQLNKGKLSLGMRWKITSTIKAPVGPLFVFEKEGYTADASFEIQKE